MAVRASSIVIALLLGRLTRARPAPNVGFPFIGNFPRPTSPDFPPANITGEPSRVRFHPFRPRFALSRLAFLFLESNPVDSTDARRPFDFVRKGRKAGRGGDRGGGGGFVVHRRELE